MRGTYHHYSKIFSDGELESIQKRGTGLKRDVSGVFHNRAKPKILEMLERWLPEAKALRQLIKGRKK